MHFWIDKRSQPYYQYGRRRAPLPLFLPGPSSHSHPIQAPASGRRPRKPSLMVTPVHRFQPIESIREEVNNHHQNRRSNGRSRSSDRRRRSRSSDRHSHHGNGTNNNRNRSELEPPSTDIRGANSRDPSPNIAASTNDSPTNTGETTSVYLSVPADDPLTSSTRTSPASPRYGYSVGEGSVVFLHRGRVQCIMWACFAMPIILMATAKFYLDNNQNAGIEFVGLGIVICLFLVLGCAVSFFRMKTRRYLVSRIAGSACNGDPESQSGTGSGHRLLLLPTTSTSPRTFRSQRLTLRPVTTSRSQPNMNDVVNENRRNTAAANNTNNSQQSNSHQVIVPVVVSNGSVSVNIPPSLLRRSHSTYSEQTMSSLSPSWSVIDGEIGGAPPPYHVAILLPAPNTINHPIEVSNSADRPEPRRETPPPSYEKAIG